MWKLNRPANLVTAGIGASALALNAAAATAVQEPTDTPLAMELGGGGPMGDAVVDCITPAERAWAEERIRNYRAQRNTARTLAGAPALFTFYPMGARLYQDVYTNNFVDLDPGGGILDWDCTNHSYNGHNGNDTDLRSFGEQAVGVPIFAALDGTVIATHDGEFDMNTSCVGTANSVIIDHGNGRVGYYWHLRNGSVAVTNGQVVKAGRQIGLTASSGCSTAPHLHFEVWDGGTRIEPYTGTCNSGTSQWTDQEPVRRDTYMRDCGVSHQNPGGFPGLPFPQPTDAQIELTDTFTYIWILTHNLPAFSTGTWEFLRPDGTIAWSGPVNWNNSIAYRWSWWWFSFNIGDMHTTTGTWTARLSINGELEMEAPIEVVVTRDPGFNRAPEPISTSIEPSLPTENDVLHCLVDADLLLDDLDYDIVEFNYVWKVNDVEVRNIVSAGHMDALPHHSASPCDEVTCTVAAGDGTDTAAPAVATVVIGTDASVDTNLDNVPDECQCVGDVNGVSPGIVNVEDLLALLAAWGTCPGSCPPNCAADVFTDCAVNVQDLLLLLARWGPCIP